MSDKSDLKAELERKKQRLAQIREEKKRKEEERKKKEVRKNVSTCTQLGDTQSALLNVGAGVLMAFLHTVAACDLTVV